jgi:transcriptional regulator with XRE-family HTH domain
LKHDELKRLALQRPEVQAAYDALGVEVGVLRQMLQARTDAGLTQAQVAERMGTKGPAVSRLESALSTGRHSPSLATLRKYAAAVGCRLEVRLIEANSGNRLGRSGNRRREAS